MVKMFALIPARPDRSLEHFHDHWRTRHRELALRLSTMRRYVQCHRIAGAVETPAEAAIEGIALVWFDDVASALGLVEDPIFIDDIAPDEPNFMDVEARRFLFTQDEDVVVDGPVPTGDAAAVKLTLLLRARGNDAGALAVAWPSTHRDAVDAAFSGCLRATQSLGIAEANEPGLGIDAIVELWFPDRSALASRWPERWDAYVNAADGIVDSSSSCAFASEDLWVIGP